MPNIFISAIESVSYTAHLRVRPGEQRRAPSQVPDRNASPVRLPPADGRDLSEWPRARNAGSRRKARCDDVDARRHHSRQRQEGDGF